ncbi:MAG: glycosyl hydrolase family 28-related protein [Nitrososphaerota archaeon]
MWYASAPVKLERLLPGWVNVKDRGIVGDGNTPVANKLQSVIDELYTRGGGVLYFPPGVYVFEDDLIVHERVKIVGAGEFSSILKSVEQYPVFLKLRPGTLITSVRIDKYIPVVIDLSPSTDFSTPVTIERVLFTSEETSQHIHIGGEQNITTTNVVIRDCRFVSKGSGLVEGIITIESLGSVIEIDSCTFDYRDTQLPTVCIYSYGCSLSIRNTRWHSVSGNAIFLSLEESKADISGLRCILKNGNKFLTGFIDENSTAVLSSISVETDEATFYYSYPGGRDQVIVLEDQIFAFANPRGATGLWLPGTSYTFSTEFVTLKAWRSNVAGEIDLEIEMKNNCTDGEAIVALVRNGQTVQSWILSFGEYRRVTPTIQLAAGDYWEIKAKTETGSNSVEVREVIGKGLLYPTRAFTDLIDNVIP